jgi:hypothetical protein
MWRYSKPLAKISAARTTVRVTGLGLTGSIVTGNAFDCVFGMIRTRSPLGHAQQADRAGAGLGAGSGADRQARSGDSTQSDNAYRPRAIADPVNGTTAV